eukprot:TRINITY_DN10123_c0_g1_i1.p1 TRINITY_DN10123_c0_g1~~TRINITY_DN10123_c0_g1_i1.p1  ORF type:complete len:275 (-),score=60.57 TRINITY_DN10123_c0_g1_i1:120-944(-)
MAKVPDFKTPWDTFWENYESGNKDISLMIDAIELLKEDEVNKLHSNKGLTILQAASKLNNNVLIEEIFKRENLDINMTNSHGETALHCCLEPETIELLCSRDEIEVNIQDRSKNHPLLVYANAYRADSCAAMLKHPKVDVNLGNNSGYNALIRVIYEKKLDIIDLLLAHPDIDVNYQDNSGWTPLIWCTFTRNLGEVIKKLLTFEEIDVNIENNKKSSAIYWSISQGDEDSSTLLIDHPGIILHQKTIKELENQCFSKKFTKKFKDVVKIQNLL